MNYDEFAFFNQQLAAMLREGIPLEGALKQLAAGLRAGHLRKELELLEDDLARGTPLPEALAQRDLPDFYRRMVEIGVRGNDLPGVLTLLADYYQRTHTLWTRLKGLMVYPFIVIVVSLGLTVVLSFLFTRFLSAFSQSVFSAGVSVLGLWIPPVTLSLAGLVLVGVLCLPKWRAQLRWRVPAFREASLAQLASALALMLRHGTPLAEALALAENLEAASPAGKALNQWRYFVEAGHGKPTQWHQPASPFPPLFLWLVQKGGEDVATGFQKAADIYQARASYRTELALYGALPISILFLGQLVLWQLVPLFRAYLNMMNMLGR